MKKKDLKTLRTKNDKEVEKTLGKKRDELMKTFLKTKTGREKNTKAVRNLRKDIAQILTIRREKEIVEKMKKKEGEKTK